MYFFHVVYDMNFNENECDVIFSDCQQNILLVGDDITHLFCFGQLQFSAKYRSEQQLSKRKSFQNAHIYLLW